MRTITLTNLQCGDYPNCSDKSTTTFPLAASTTASSSTLSTITLPAGSISITAGNPVWPAPSSASPTAPANIKRNITDSPEEYCGFACGKSDCAYVCRKEPFYGVFISHAILRDGGLVSVNLGNVDQCAEWACGSDGCVCGKHNGDKATKRSPSPQEILGDGKDKMECGYGCNQNSCARICMTAEYVDAYKKYPHTIWVPEYEATSWTTIALVTSQFCWKWTCSASGCQCSSKNANMRGNLRQ
jgi:hypothetical protein